MPIIYNNEDEEPGKNGTFPDGDSSNGERLFVYVFLGTVLILTVWYLASVWL